MPVVSCPVDNKNYVKVNSYYCSFYYYVFCTVLDTEDLLLIRPTKTLIKDTYIHMGGE